MPPRSMSDGPAFEKLGAAECWRLLASRAFGRVCLCVGDQGQVVLTAYVVREGRVYFRATAYGALARQVASRRVTLQVDDMPADRQATWSVTFAGATERVVGADAVAALWSPLRPSPWESGPDPLWIALDPDDVQGQRVRPEAA